MIRPHHFFKYKYPKLTFFVICIVAAYFLFKYGLFSGLINHMGEYGLFSVFIAGILFAFGFTSPFAVAYFVALNPSSILITTVIGGLGTLLGDLVIFSIIKVSFMNEFNRLEHEKLIRRAEKFFGEDFHGKFWHYFLIVFAGFIIASPLPNEIGITMFAGLGKINHYFLAVLSFVLGALGIVFLLWI